MRLRPRGRRAKGEGEWARLCLSCMVRAARSGGHLEPSAMQVLCGPLGAPILLSSRSTRAALSSVATKKSFSLVRMVSARGEGEVKARLRVRLRARIGRRGWVPGTGEGCLPVPVLK